MYKRSVIRARIPLGKNGFTGEEFPAESYLVEAKNVIYENSIIRTIGGVRKFDAAQVAGAPSCYGATMWEPDINNKKIVTAWNNGKVYMEVSGDIDSIELKDWGSNLVGPVIMQAAGKESAGENSKLLVFSEEKEPFYIDGDNETVSSLTPSIDWSGAVQPLGAELHDGRVCAFLRHNVYFTPVDDHTDFNGADSFVMAVMPGEGQEIRAVVSMLPTQLLVAKYPYGLYLVDTADIATADYLPVHTFSNEIGFAGPRAYTFVGSDLWFLDSNGMLRSLMATDTSKDLRDSNIFAQLDMSDWVKRYINRRNLKFAELLYDDANQILYINFTDKTGSNNNSRIIVNLQRKDNPKVSFDMGRGELFASSFFYRDNGENYKILAGSSDGYVREVDVADRNIDGATLYTARIRTPQDDFRWLEPIIQAPIADMFKLFKSIRLSVVGTLNSTLTCKPYIDGIPCGSGFTVRIDGDSTNEILTVNSEFDLTDSLVTSEVESLSRVDHVELIGCRGRYISLAFEFTGDCKLMDMYINFKLNSVKGLG